MNIRPGAIGLGRLSRPFNPRQAGITASIVPISFGGQAATRLTGHLVSGFTINAVAGGLSIGEILKGFI